MKVRVGINGFGRIGRNFLRVALKNPNIQVVAINDLVNGQTLAHLLKYDSTQGPFNGSVKATKTTLTVNGQTIFLSQESAPEKIPWNQHEVGIVIESSGRFRQHQEAARHFKAGAKKVIISAPAKDVPTIILGVNEAQLTALEPDIVSCGSCTTNSLAPVLEIIRQQFGIKRAMMTTVHSYTPDQALLDGPHSDWRRGRAAGINIVPTSTGAASAVIEAIPDLDNKFSGLAVRVPTSVVSLTDLTVLLERPTNLDSFKNQLKTRLADSYYRGILAYTQEPLVSSDFIGNHHSGVIDLSLTDLVGGDLLKLVIWYDNERGYSHRLVEMTSYLANSLEGNNAN